MIVEKKADVCHKLKSNFVAAVEADAASAQQHLVADVYQAKLASKAESDYVNLKFILASAAEVERIWSMTKYVLVQQHKGMSPKVFECLFFLKCNCQFWNKCKVIEAYLMTKNKKSTDRQRSRAQK